MGDCPDMESTVATFYHFVDLPDCDEWENSLQACCDKTGVLGTIILAREGLNATVAGPKKGVEALLDFIRCDKRFANMPHRECTTERLTFYRLRIIIRDEIVTLGDPPTEMRPLPKSCGLARSCWRFFRKAICSKNANQGD